MGSGIAMTTRSPGYPNTISGECALFSRMGFPAICLHGSCLLGPQISAFLWLICRHLWLMKGLIRTKYKPKFLLGRKATCSIKFSSLTAAAGLWGFFFGFVLVFAKVYRQGGTCLSCMFNSLGMSLMHAKEVRA